MAGMIIKDNKAVIYRANLVDNRVGKVIVGLAVLCLIMLPFLSLLQPALHISLDVISIIGMICLFSSVGLFFLAFAFTPDVTVDKLSGQICITYFGHVFRSLCKISDISAIQSRLSEEQVTYGRHHDYTNVIFVREFSFLLKNGDFLKIISNKNNEAMEQLTDELSSFINVPVIDKGIEGAENTQTDVVYAPSQEELANGVDTDSDKPFYKKPVHIDNIERKLEKHHEENIQIQQTADGYEISVTPAKDGQTQMDIPESLFYMAGPFLLLTIMGFITFFVEKRSFFNKLYIEMFLVWLGLGIAIFIMVKNSFAKPMTVCINEKDLIFRIGKRITKSVKLDSITDIHTQVGIHETAWIEVYAMTDHITVRNSLKVPTCRALCREIRRLTAEIKSRPVE